MEWEHVNTSLYITRTNNHTHNIQCHMYVQCTHTHQLMYTFVNKRVNECENAHTHTHTYVCIYTHTHFVYAYERVNARGW